VTTRTGCAPIATLRLGGVTVILCRNCLKQAALSDGIRLHKITRRTECKRGSLGLQPCPSPGGCRCGELLSQNGSA
jgi:hypothetical protein